MVGQLVISAGLDQRLVVWSLSSLPSGGPGLTWLASKTVSVADISQLDCWEEAGHLHCVVAGVGLEILAISPPD